MKYNIDFFTKKFKELPSEIEIAVLGTTQGHFAFDFSGMKINGANLCMTLNGLDYQKSFLMKYQSKIKKEAKILLTLEYPIFLCAEAVEGLHELNVQYARCILGYHPYLSVDEEQEYYRNPYQYITSPMFTDLKRAMQRNRAASHMRTYEIDREVQELVHNGWEKATYPVKIFDYSKFKFAEERKEKISFTKEKVMEVEKYCRENGWELILIGLPYSENLSDRIPDDFINDNFYEPIEEIVDETGIRFLDYSKDEEFSSIHNYFNTWFLNDVGRKKFAMRVVEDCGNA